MTFTEAAVEVLRLVGKPLHYKRITELAIEHNLLSHVGKTPEVTMSSRLATMVKRDRGDAPIVKVKPGVFGLRGVDGESLTEAPTGSSEAAEGTAEASAEQAVEGGESASEAGESGESVSEETVAVATTPAVKAPSRPLPGSDVFPEEDDDDEPIFGPPASAEDSEEDGEGDTDGEGRSKRRRRRRKRGRGEDGEEVTAAPPRETSRDRDRDAGRRRARDRSDRDRDRDRSDRGRDEQSAGDWNREHADGDLVGKDLADSVVSVLQLAGRSGMSAMRIAERLVRKGRLAGDPAGLIPTISAAVRADLARALGEGQRPRFRLEGGSIVLVEALLPQDLVRAEQDVLRAAERQRDRARRAFLRRLGDLPFAGLAELLATWLNAEGVVSLRAVRRPGTSGGELHMAGTFRRGTEETRLAIVFYRDGRDLGRERVIEVRGALHHYGNASAAWLVTMGQVLSGAREEATAPGTPPIAVFDGAALAGSMERVGVGLTRYSALLTGLDFELLDALGGDSGRSRDGRRGRTERPERSDRSERSERSDRSERSERSDRSERSERSEDRNEEDRPRRRRERSRGPEPETPEEDAVAAPASGEGSTADNVEGNETGEGEAGEGGRRRRRRRRRGRDRADGAAAGTAQGDEGSDDAETPSKERAGSTEEADADAAGTEVAQATAVADGSGGTRVTDGNDADRPARGRETGDDDDTDSDDDQDERDDEYDSDDEDEDEPDERDYDEDERDDEYDDDEDEPRTSSRWTGSDSDDDDGDGEDRSQHRDEDSDRRDDEDRS